VMLFCLFQRQNTMNSIKLTHTFLKIALFMCHKIIYSLLMTHCCLLKHTPFNLSVKKLKYPAIMCIVYAVQVQMHTGDYSNYTRICMHASKHTCARMHTNTHAPTRARARTHTHTPTPTHTHSYKQSLLNMRATSNRTPLRHLILKQAQRVRNFGSQYKLLTFSMLIVTKLLACFAQ
jgi:hypothetical protein